MSGNSTSNGHLRQIELSPEAVAAGIREPKPLDDDDLEKLNSKTFCICESPEVALAVAKLPLPGINTGTPEAYVRSKARFDTVLILDFGDWSDSLERIDGALRYKRPDLAIKLSAASHDDLIERVRRNPWFGGGGADYIDLPEPVSTKPGPDDRPEIEDSHELHLVHRAVVDRVLPRMTNCFALGDCIVQVSVEPEPESKAIGITFRNTRGSHKAVIMGEATLMVEIARHAKFHRWKKDKFGEEIAVATPPPRWLPAAILGMKRWPQLRTLSGIINAPFIGADATLRDQQGYDDETQTVYVRSVAINKLPDNPSQNDAHASAGVIAHLVRQFPFHDKHLDFSVVLAAILTAIQRPAIAGPVPGFAFIANAPGSGKGLLIDFIGLIASGVVCPTTTWPRDDAEAAKVRTAIAIAAKGLVHFDNLSEGSQYGGAAIDGTMTSMIVDDRILGSSQLTGAMPIRPCWFLSGNNITPGKDAHRRWIPCNLRTDLENPHERTDLEVEDLRTYTLKNRSELLWHALVILKAHAVAGRPRAAEGRLGSFEEWDSVVRGATFYATGCDPVQNMRSAAKDAPERMERLALLESWRELDGGGNDGPGCTADDAIGAVSKFPEKHPNLHAALCRMTKDGKLPTVRALGLKLRGLSGRTIDSFRLEKVGEHRHTSLWRVVKF